jgi:hypothetical protein
MACLRSRVMAGDDRWLHACHCCDSGAPSAPWGAWSGPGQTSIERQDVVAELGAVPSRGQTSSGAGAVPDEHLRQVPDVLGTGTVSWSAAWPGRTCLDVDDQGVGGLVDAVSTSSGTT